jgi:hypothetical protein
VEVWIVGVHFDQSVDLRNGAAQVGVAIGRDGASVARCKTLI